MKLRRTNTSKVLGEDAPFRMSQFVVTGMVLAVVATMLTFMTLASPSTSSSETESGTLTGGVTTVSNAGASSGQAIKFGSSPDCAFTDASLCSLSLVWNDEFNDATVDTNKWNVFSNSNYGTGNNEDQCYLTNNAAEAGGLLTITAKRETVSCGGTNPDTGNSTYYFTSGFLRSKYNLDHGYIEASIKAPKGNPYWVGFWLTGGTGAPGWPSYGEMDITETLGIRPDASYGTFHWACTGASQCQTSPNTYNMASDSAVGGDIGTLLSTSNFATYNGLSSQGFVKYGLRWDTSKLTWYVNGRKVRSFDGTNVVRYDAAGNPTTEKIYGTNWLNANPPTTSFSTVLAYNHVINLNLSVGGSFPQSLGYTGQDSGSGYSDGNLAATIPDAMQVDYVRVYQ